ncbi:ATP-binding protein [Streptomyces sp. PSKA28]|uniref:ATP-binding protein n=1 Tax=Streptomyces himalayensis subsp. himalayensis TaxID=2756131 RepID=A0A7W0DFR7_9ACTN|nr:ATP-binding protein [Streptomyces himalayensis subsp. himalayensis]
MSSCPSPTPVQPTPPPTPEALAYSLTLPAAPASPAVARAAARTILRTHGLQDVTDAAVQVVGELAACACRFTPTAEVYVSLRYREGALRVILYDGHPRHTHPRLAAACEARRRADLRVLACVVRACGGDWGFGEAREPTGGTRMWAVLPSDGARAYADAVPTAPIE